jgi:serine/threonine-protein kinase
MNAPNTIPAGTVFSERYEILSAAGSGGMGHVYRARHLGLDKLVALKVLAVPGKGSRGERFEERFAREARVLAKLDHPSCVRVLDYGRSNGMQYIAMDMLEGETLHEVLRAGPMPTSRALAITKQLLGALAHAHEHGIIHRDLKPENVMLVKGGTRAVLIDFGLASLHDEAALTGAGMCMGSPSYLAPERLLGRPHDTRTDLYALGVILYEMVAGVRPFAGGSPEETMRLALHRPPRPLRAIRRDISRELENLIKRALAKDPKRRFSDAEEMLLALNDVPTDEERAERRAAAEREEAAETMAMVQLDLRPPSWWQRLWAYLRYGGWRWAIAALLGRATG